jgi:hypothetical protein
MPATTSYRICLFRQISTKQTLTEYQHSATHATSSCVNSEIRNSKSNQELNNKICYLRTEHFLAAMEKQEDEGGGRILLDDNTSSKAVKLRPVIFRRVGASISSELNFIYS